MHSGAYYNTGDNMKLDKSKLKIYGIFLLITGAVGGLSALLTNMGMESYKAAEKPPLTPPDIVFPIVWSILFTLMAISAARVWLTDNSRMRNRSMLIYALQLFFNFVWSILFFNLEAYGLAFLWLIVLWVLILLMIIQFYKSDKIAGLLQIPYLLWVSFAGYLNYMVWMLNK